MRDQPHAALIIQRCYSRFLAESNDNEDREYPDAADQIREVLIHGNYLSKKDLDICRGFDLTSLASHPQHEGLCELHDALIAEYGSKDEPDVL